MVVPRVAFTAVNSTRDSTKQFTARQILLNAEITPASSPEQHQSPSGQTESESASPVGLTSLPQTPATQDGPPSQTIPSTTDTPKSRNALGDLTCQTSNSNVPTTKEKRPRGRPKGWRKKPNSDTPDLPEVSSSTEEPEKPKKKRKINPAKEEDQWSVRIRTSIKDAMIEHLVKGIKSLKI
jgi:hypothetical protein